MVIILSYIEYFSKTIIIAALIQIASKGLPEELQETCNSFLFRLRFLIINILEEFFGRDNLEVQFLSRIVSPFFVMYKIQQVLTYVILNTHFIPLKLLFILVYLYSIANSIPNIDEFYEMKVINFSGFVLFIKFFLLYHLLLNYGNGIIIATYNQIQIYMPKDQLIFIAFLFPCTSISTLKTMYREMINKIQYRYVINDLEESVEIF
ncbi:MAG: hypothetical protein OEZ01_10130 [Candidatus Heimdallarchaeota archaeon]|nr:hypothetical protein [Candidatus Heimdallarchaeota archaeon]MDH5646356.1 hypothetical protein [Candidatus Heimdallarchaeota archaeon]